MESNIDDPLKPVPFKRLHIGQVEQAHEYIRKRAGIKGTLENMHLCPRAAELRWNKALKEEEDIEPEQRQSRCYDIPSEEVPPSS